VWGTSRSDGAIMKIKPHWRRSYSIASRLLFSTRARYLVWAAI